MRHERLLDAISISESDSCVGTIAAALDGISDLSPLHIASTPSFSRGKQYGTVVATSVHGYVVMYTKRKEDITSRSPLPNDVMSGKRLWVS